MLLDLNNIKKNYDSPSGVPTRTVLKDLSLKAIQGESIAIVGPSGSGKSTLLNIIGTLDKPTEGVIHFDGQELAVLSEEDLSLIRSKKIGFIFQQHHLLPQCTVLENVLLPTLANKSNENKQSTLKRAKELLARVDLSAYLDQRPARLSGGEQQRVAVVRALINKPKLVLADEPTGSLDQLAAENLGQLLVTLNQEEGVTLIVVTHAPNLAGHMQSTYDLVDGKLENRVK